MTAAARKPVVYATYPDLAGKRVVITGGGTGIGAAIVDAFANRARTLSSSISRTRPRRRWSRAWPVRRIRRASSAAT